MQGFLAPTDHGWYQHFLARQPVEEVNFWRPGGTRFRALSPGEPFFFKLKRPHVGIGGFGLFARFAQLPLWRAWEVFGASNGVADERAFHERLSRLSSQQSGRLSPDTVIGCISITAPVFFPPDEWVAVPSDWKANIVSGRSYDLSSGEGARMWRECLDRAAAGRVDWAVEAQDDARRGAPALIRPRLGQGAFRIAVMEAYNGACAVTTEHSLPALEAAHIRPFADGGAHSVANGLPLRRDVHRLFDLGYVTVRPDLRFAVSRALRDDFKNGRVYYALDGRHIELPSDPAVRPDRDSLTWHGDTVFRG